MFILKFTFYFLIQLLKGEKWSLLVLNDLCYKFTYRLSPDIIHGKITFLRCCYWAFKEIWHSRLMLVGSDKNIAIYDSFESDFEDRNFYLNDISYIKDADIYIARNQMPNVLVFFEKVLISILSLCICLVSFFFYLIKKNNNLALFIMENVEMFLLIKFVRVNKINTLYIFNTYEKDMPYICYACNYFDIRTELFPSPNPIKLFHKTVIASKVYFSAPFQRIEAEVLKENWLVGDFDVIPPMDFNRVVIKSQNVKYMYKVGILSSSMAFRQTLGYPVGNINELYAEMALHSVVKELLIEDFLLPSDILIYLHPKEKEAEGGVPRVAEYYRSTFGVQFDFAPTESPSREYFFLSEIGLGTISSSQMERLYGGYKTIFSTFGFLDNIYSDARLDLISANSKDHLKFLIKGALEITESSFFTKYNLMDYHYSFFENRLQ